MRERDGVLLLGAGRVLTRVDEAVHARVEHKRVLRRAKPEYEKYSIVYT